MGSVRKFAHVIKAFVSLVIVLAFSKTVNVLLALHLLDTNSLCLDSLSNSNSNVDFKFFVNFFSLLFLCMFHLSTGRPFGMGFECF